jgi:membrane-associated phospholipid phosphatase
VSTIEKSNRLDGPMSARTLALSHLWWVLLVVAAVVYSVVYLDRPVSRFCERMFGYFTWADNFTDAPSFFHPIALLLFGIFLIRRFAAQPFGKPDIICLLGDASLLLSDFITGRLKYVFGRTWPKYGYPSYLRQDVYGFNPFHSGVAYQSFPSGHVAALCSVLVVLWILYPRFRALYALTALGSSAGLIAMNYHFLSDTIAGGLVGTLIGALCVFAWQRWSLSFKKLIDMLRA